MAVLRIVRFKTDPAQAEEMLRIRAGLIAATRERYPGLTETRLARVDEETWLDHWRWESAGRMQEALNDVATIPGAREAFALVSEAQPEVVEIVEETVA